MHKLRQTTNGDATMLFCSGLGRDEATQGVYLPLQQDEGGKGRVRDVRGGRGGRRRRWTAIALLLAGMLVLFTVAGVVIWRGRGAVRGGSDSTHTYQTSRVQRPCEVTPQTAVSYDSVSPLILVSIDGFRYDYLHRGLTPHLLALAKRGVYGPMRPQFPSYTFPNHYTLVTGLYPETHGIVANSFYDPRLNCRFSYTNQTNLRESHWWGGEPIWNTVQRAGMRSATMYWPGSESAIGGCRPTYHRRYDEGETGAARVDQVLAWIDLPDGERPHFLSLYLSAVDDAGHQYGPDSLAVDAALMEVDRTVGRLLQGLRGRELLHRVNLVVVSDHGMATVGDRIVLDELVRDMRHRLRWVDYGPVASILPRRGEEDAVYAELKAGEKKSRGAFRVYRRGEIPADLHYRANARIAPIVLVAREGAVVDFAGSNWTPRGIHGYDPRVSAMQALMIVAGPGLKRVGRGAMPLTGVTNLDIYPLMMHLLQTPPLPNNGTRRLVNACLKSP